MPRRITAAMLVLTLGLAGARQARAQQNLLGVKAGVAVSHIAVGTTTVGSRTGAGFGVFVQRAMMEPLSAQAEFLFLAKGGEIRGETVTVEYVQLPVLLQAHVPLGLAVSTRVFAGPSVAFEISCGEDCGTDRTVEFGAVFGAGLQMPAGPVILTLDGRYDLGITDLNEEGGASIRNRSWQVFAGAAIPFEKSF